MKKRRDPLTRTPARTFISAAEEETTNHSGGHVPFLSPFIKAATRHREEEEEEERCLATLTLLTLKKGGKVMASRDRLAQKKKTKSLSKGRNPKIPLREMQTKQI